MRVGMDTVHAAASEVLRDVHEETGQQEMSPFSLVLNVIRGELDWEKASVSLWLFFFCFLLLSPDIWKWRLWRKEKGERIQVHPRSPSISKLRNESIGENKIESFQRSTTSSITVGTGVICEVEETEEEFFEKHYDTIRISPYRRLVLPPECKRIERPRVIGKIKPKRKEVPQSEDFEEDHPLRRLQYYTENILFLLRSILSYDYAGAFRTICNWLQVILKMRSKRSPQIEQPEDDDDASIASAATFRSTTPQYNLEKEKKDEAIMLQQTISVYENAETSPDLGEADVGEKGVKVPLGLRQRNDNSNKKKDSLDGYRFTPGRPPISPMTPFSSPASHNVHFLEEKSPLRCVGQREASSSSDGMSYFDAAHSRESLSRLNVEVPVPDRNGYILGDEFLANTDDTPLLVFVNSRSGPQQGQLLITQLRRLLNPIQIWDLAIGGPEKVLQSFCVMSRLRILVCGGDGTVSWIISALERMTLTRNPPIAILPLGTGNDLARMHGWGGGYNNESLISILEQVAESYISLLDRWEMNLENKKGRILESKSFFNYLGVGVDAQAALQVHMLRESRPKLFFSRIVNKAWYAVFGAEDAIKASHANLPNEITLIADGVEVPLPEDSQGIILLNIDSYAGGVPMWGMGTKPKITSRLNFDETIDPFILKPKSGNVPTRIRSFESMYTRDVIVETLDRIDNMDNLASADTFPNDIQLGRVTACDMPSSCQDGVLDIVSIRGTFHLGQIRVGLSNAQRLCQCREATIIIKQKVAVQIDGEPWRQDASTVRVTRKKDPAIMLHRSPDESGGVETEMAKLLDWAEERHIIDQSAHATMMKEFSRRIESKTRQRRVKSQDNLMQSLKRAITTRNSLSNTSLGPITFTGNLAF